MTDPVLGTVNPAAHLYEPDGLTFVADLTTARGIKWQHELSKPGAGSFEIPLADAGSIGDRSIVKFSWLGAIRFGIVIRSERNSLAVDGTRWVKFQDQPGLLSLLGDAVVYPEYGLNRYSPAVRNFGYMSADGPWRVGAEWVVPQSAPFGDLSGAHRVCPKAFASLDPDAKWIAFSDPDTDVATNTVNYFRAAFTLTAARDVAILAAGDNWLELFIDDEQVIAPDRASQYGWAVATRVNLRMQAGDHLICAKVENSPFTSTDRPNPIGFLLTMLKVDADTGEPVSDSPTHPRVIHTTTTGWSVSGGDPEPGWSRGQVLFKLVGEAQDRAVLGPSLLTVDFDDEIDSDGEDWTDRGEYAFDVGTISLADVATQLAEADVDVDVDAGAMMLQCFNRRGGDLSATVALTLGNGPSGDLTAYDATRTSSRFTVVLTNLAKGTWLEKADTAAVAAVGRVEVGLNVGSTNCVTTALDIAAAQLDESAATLLAFTGESSTLAGAQAYVDYGLGDSITAPGGRSEGTIKVRVLSITVDSTADPVRAWPEFVQDNT